MIDIDIGDVHIWTARFTGRIEDIVAFEGVLSESEKVVADSFCFERHRLRYIFSHAAMRSILSRYLDRPPEELQFSQNSFGKPFLMGAGTEALDFNMSHSGDVVAVGVTRRRLIGVDVEMLRTIEDFAEIARLNFTPSEYAFIKNSSAGNQQRAFFSLWARKEAVIKAIGKGLSIPLNTFDTSIAPGDERQRLSIPVDGPEIGLWRLADLSVGAGYVGAVVVEQAITRLMYMTWPRRL